MEKVDNGTQFVLPLVLWDSILAHLPVKSVVRFRSVSKSLKSIIEDPKFSSIHLKHCPNNIQNPYLIFCEETPCEEEHRWFLCHSETFQNSLKIEFAAGDEKWEIFNGVNGIILLRKAKNILLWNPSIKKAVYFPLPNIPLNEVSHDLCLLFDEASDDYKVMIVYLGICPTGYRIADVFSLKIHSWQTVVDNPARNRMYLSGHCTCIGGSSAHWFGGYLKKFARGVISFTVTSNMFSFIPFPTQDFYDRKLIVLSGSILGLLEESPVDNHSTIWTIERSSSSQFWVKKYQIHVDLHPCRTLCVTVQKRDLLIWKHDQALRCIYDLEAGELKFLSDENKLVYSNPYVESLFLLEGLTPLQGDQ